jgi:putative salt-induced outer membrane protein
LLLVPCTGRAEAPRPPKGTVEQSAATKGATELEGQGKFGNATEAADETRASEFQIALGGLVSTGNARAIAGTGSSQLRLRRGMHQASAAAAANYGRAAVDRDSDPKTTVGNLQTRARYDLFFAKRWSVFAMVTARHDPFQGLELRLNVDPGLAFHVLTKKNHRLWAEAGYDIQYDLRADEAIIERDENGDAVLDADGNTIPTADEDQVNHAARLFGGYSNRLSEHVAFDTGLEYLQSLIKAERWRLNWDVSLSTQVGPQFSMALTFSLRHDSDPLPGIAELDTVTAVNLVYRFP